LKPCASAVNWYCPAGRLASVYLPVSVDVEEYTLFVSECVAVTLVPGTAAAEGSCTNPLIVPRSNWPKSKTEEVIVRITNLRVITLFLPCCSAGFQSQFPGALSIYEPGGGRSFEDRNGNGYNEGFSIVGMEAVNRWTDTYYAGRSKDY
jgi:hypothetical protein